jgi:hypothetical protein
LKNQRSHSGYCVKDKITTVYIPAQITPAPAYPGKQAHWKDPIVLVQKPFAWQLCVFLVHSLISEKECEFLD